MTLEACFKRYLDESFRLRPSEATSLGDHRFDHLLDDLSSKARAGWVEHARTTLEQLPKQVDLQKLSPAEKIDAAILDRKSVV